MLVGDHPVNDVAGAHGAGWRSVWIDREGEAPFPDDGPRPDAVVASLLDLPGLLPGSAATDSTTRARPGRAPNYFGRGIWK